MSLSGNARLFEACQNLLQHQRVGTKIFAAHGADLDAHHIALFEEHAPAIDPGRRAGEFLHAPAHHLLHGFGLVGVADDAAGMFHGDDAAGEGPGMPGFVVAARDCDCRTAAAATVSEFVRN